MKTFKTLALKKRRKPCALALIIIWQLGFSQHMVAQNNINNINVTHPNLGNLINVNINNDFDQMPIINNGSNNNSQFSQSINVAVIKKKTVSPVKMANTAPIYKPKAKPANTTSNKQLAVNNKPKPIVKPKKPIARTQKKALVTEASVNKPVIDIQQSMHEPTVNEVKNVLPNPKQAVITENTITAPPPMQSSNEVNVKSNVSKSLRLKGSANKTNHHTYASKRKKINHFRYSTNKKIAKLFARNKKSKMDITKCFAWS
jgi:hypothetical protein